MLVGGFGRFEEDYCKAYAGLSSTNQAKAEGFPENYSEVIDMPSYKCTRFNRSANVPSRMCECGKQAITISKGRKWVCPEHGNTKSIKLCDCDGCQNSYAVLRRSNFKTRPWYIKGRALERPNRQQHLKDRERYKQIWATEGLPRHICPICKKTSDCSEPFKIKPDCGEKIPHSPDPYAHCPINEALEKGEGSEWWDRRACGGFWPTNPFMLGQQLQDHIFYFHDTSRYNLTREVKVKDAKLLHKCKFILHKCVSCGAEWKSQERMLPAQSAYKYKHYLGTLD